MLHQPSSQDKGQELINMNVLRFFIIFTLIETMINSKVNRLTQFVLIGILIHTFMAASINTKASPWQKNLKPGKVLESTIYNNQIYSLAQLSNLQKSDPRSTGFIIFITDDNGEFVDSTEILIPESILQDVTKSLEFSLSTTTQNNIFFNQGKLHIIVQTDAFDKIEKYYILRLNGNFVDQISCPTTEHIVNIESVVVKSDVVFYTGISDYGNRRLYRFNKSTHLLVGNLPYETAAIYNHEAHDSLILFRKVGKTQGYYVIDTSLNFGSSWCYFPENKIILENRSVIHTGNSKALVIATDAKYRTLEHPQLSSISKIANSTSSIFYQTLDFNDHSKEITGSTFNSVFRITGRSYQKAEVIAADKVPESELVDVVVNLNHSSYGNELYLVRLNVEGEVVFFRDFKTWLSKPNKHSFNSLSIDHFQDGRVLITFSRSQSLSSYQEESLIFTTDKFGCFINNCESFGCTDPLALNYNPDAEIDDETCVYGSCSDQIEVHISSNNTFTRFHNSNEIRNTADLKLRVLGLDDNKFYLDTLIADLCRSVTISLGLNGHTLFEDLDYTVCLPPHRCFRFEIVDEVGLNRFSQGSEYYLNYRINYNNQYFSQLIAGQGDIPHTLYMKHDSMSFQICESPYIFPPQKERYSIHPNPANSYVYVQMPEFSEVEAFVRVINSNGEIIQTTDIHPPYEKIALNCVSGFYVLEVYEGNNTAPIKRTKLIVY